ncbi:unnamed protein product [Vitrella brassicaformis CCMP3155]|uniref:Retrotransposon gag domain-containing protein n=1 Tax=Vitrella brassicaformis (strain CCMP3155) TaxID=1169540 RepID=A0A0G4ELB4_VITBC|nr:unnamed protein product [Vitrella brassicaformis CCMP3155]|eukprot:CEL97794.1 unnamed protein product [Vitrella brassicaformis CCMP3155]
MRTLVCSANGRQSDQHVSEPTAQLVMSDLQKPSVSLRTFNGTSDLTAEAFIDDIRLAESMFNLKGGRILPFIMSALQETARTRVTRWMHKHGEVWQALSQAARLEHLLTFLKTEFGQKKSQTLVTAEQMKAWRQKPKQTFETAFDEFNELYQKSQKSEPEAVEIFIDGLQSDLRAEIYRKDTDPRTFGTIKELGLNAEVWLIRTRKRPKEEDDESDAEATRPQKLARLAVNAIEQQPEKGTGKHEGTIEQHKGLESVLASVNAMTTEVMKNIKEIKDSRPQPQFRETREHKGPNTWPNSSNGRWNRDATWKNNNGYLRSSQPGQFFDGVCDYCKKYGHKWKDCRTRLRHNSQGQRLRPPATGANAVKLEPNAVAIHALPAPPAQLQLGRIGPPLQGGREDMKRAGLRYTQRSDGIWMNREA